ncbi:MAG: bifunctional diaminohydroxyphosphoribosylaminopyrimidine deaminase/5-amino-6-(5-phosphoribosylamino)uracil reductase RibD [Zoogloeaceae bacterium]|jgi:diaminohydroxyphosphoribosylaminopyrimidine deaminase/5-amino-6-(5-phosphoribosylamino)uracil reductase|nr:bifunctional diaminohydroxyphosphoribosylaminopyrimidine deaminase/5-amino-6-(5-phosphoribosylamino)uracil reductase RibD [Zoogloeaceae bacterium]
MSFTETDRQHMSRALQLAARGLNTTTPNPRVGCVLVKADAVVGEGWHEWAGEAHAEVHALRDAGAAARGATAYITLEPCVHHGRTPPCADALIEAGVTRVIAAMRDPNPLVAGQGFIRLQQAGITVETGLLDAEAEALNIGFVSRMTRGRPWLRLKIAASLDGKTALLNGRSQWITGAEARRHAHGWRARSCAIMTGSGTIIADDPSLTVREVPCMRQPLRIVIDSRLQTPPNAKILTGTGALIFTAQTGSLPNAEIIALPDATGKVDLAGAMAELGRRGINELLVEGGTRLNGALLRAGLVDELLIYQAPLLIGDQAQGMFDLPETLSLTEARQLDIIERCQLGRDTFLRARLCS